MSRISHEFSIYNDSTTITLSSPAIKETNAREALEGNDSFRAAMLGGKLMILSLAEDEPIDGRIVMGELTAEEQATWLGRVRGKIDASDGKISIQAAFNGFQGEGYFEDAQQYVCDVEPGLYQVDCYVYMPATTAIFMQDPDDELKIAKWWRESQGNENYPDWIVHAALESYGMDDDEMEDTYWEERREAELDDMDENLSGYITFVFHLTPLLDGDDIAVTDIDRYGFKKWDSRQLDKCPTGIRCTDTLTA